MRIIYCGRVSVNGIGLCWTLASFEQEIVAGFASAGQVVPAEGGGDLPELALGRRGTVGGFCIDHR